MTDEELLTEVRRLLCRLVWAPAHHVGFVFGWSDGDDGIRPEPSASIIGNEYKVLQRNCDCSIKSRLRSLKSTFSRAIAS